MRHSNRQKSAVTTGSMIQHQSKWRQWRPALTTTTWLRLCQNKSSSHLHHLATLNKITLKTIVPPSMDANSGRNSGSGGSYGHFHRILDPGLFTIRSLLHWRTTGMWRHDVTKNPEVVGVRPEATRITSLQYRNGHITIWNHDLNTDAKVCVFVCF